MDVCVSGKCGQLSACALGLAFGVVTALFMGVLGIAAWHFKFGEAWVTLVSSVYIGFAGTPKGIGIGVLWGFVDGYVTGMIIAWVYNFCVKRCHCKHCNPGK